MESTILSLLPLILIQTIYAIFIAQIAKRTEKSVLKYVVISLIPFIGAFFFIYVMWSTLLGLLDSVNQLKAQIRSS